MSVTPVANRIPSVRCRRGSARLRARRIGDVPRARGLADEECDHRPESHHPDRRRGDEQGVGDPVDGERQPEDGDAREEGDQRREVDDDQSHRRDRGEERDRGHRGDEQPIERLPVLHPRQVSGDGEQAGGEDRESDDPRNHLVEPSRRGLRADVGLLCGQDRLEALGAQTDCVRDPGGDLLEGVVLLNPARIVEELEGLSIPDQAEVDAVIAHGRSKRLRALEVAELVGAAFREQIARQRPRGSGLRQAESGRRLVDVAHQEAEDEDEDQREEEHEEDTHPVAQQDRDFRSQEGPVCAHRPTSHRRRQTATPADSAIHARGTPTASPVEKSGVPTPTLARSPSAR